MKLPNFCIIFDRRKTASQTSGGYVEVRVSHERKSKYYPTGVKVLPSQWDNSKHVIKHADAGILNAKIDAVFDPIKNYIVGLSVQSKEFSFSSLESHLDKSKRGESFVEFAENTIKERTDITESTRKNHKRLVSFLKNQFKDISVFSDLTPENIIKFDNKLHKAGYKQTTVYTYHKFMKVYIHEALKREYIEKDPYATLSFDKGKYEERKYLTAEELKAIREAESDTEYIQRAKDLFLFQCNTGLAYAELESFDFKNVEEREDRLILRGRRKKTHEDYYIVLLPEAVEILKKYGNTLPLVSNQKYNQYLKLLAGIAKIKKNLTSHMARHSFAVNVLNSGIGIETLSKMLGHSDIKTTKIYAKVLDKTIESAFDILAKK